MIRHDARALFRAQLVQQLRRQPAFLAQVAAELVVQALGDCGQPAPSGRVITVVNQSTTVADADFEAAVAAVNQQIQDDFLPAWGLTDVTLVAGQDTAAERIYVLDNATQAGVLGYHTEDPSLVPVGYVFAGDSIAAGFDWASVLSHEALEQIVDPWTLGLMIGVIQGQQVGIAYEVCDPVENDEYVVAGRQVSNYVLPEWFNLGYSGACDQMGNVQVAGGMSAGGYIAYTADLLTWQQIFGAKTPTASRQVAPFSRRFRRFKKAVRKAVVVAPPKK